MRSFRSAFSVVATVAITGSGLACSTEPLTLGTASVAGQVLHASGAPWGAVSLEVLCAISPDTTRVVAAPDGGFLIGFQFPDALRGTRSTSTVCRFAVPNLRAPVALTTDTITVYPPNLQPEQLVTVREGQL